MNSLTIHILPQYVRMTELTELFPDGNVHRLHEVQKRMKTDFDSLPEFTIITAPTGTGKSYAFPFPVLESKARQGGYDDTLRACIVLPTNALIDELTENFTKTYPSLTIQRLTGVELDARQVKGFERWETALTICKASDLVITNPDIINYAMHGGYHKLRSDHKSGGKGFENFLEMFDYFVFDEYHLYDEAQIANLLTLVKMRSFFLPHKKVRYLFVSATPEEGLKKILHEEELPFVEIIETIIDDPNNARPIHGKLKVEFVECNDLEAVVEEKKDEWQGEWWAGRRSLLITDKLRDVHLLVKSIRAECPDMKVFESSGYQSKKVDMKPELAAADLIVATNKAEVGVNYGVEYCIMQTGKYFRNFVQRFGRVSRGDLEGKVVVLVKDFATFNRLKKTFEDKIEVGYYDFLNLIRPHFQEKRFYDELVPWLSGEYVWCIENNIAQYQEFNTGLFFHRRMKEEGFFQGKLFARYKLMDEMDELILKGMKLALRTDKISKWNYRRELTRLKSNPRVRDWALWWQEYLETYFSFRDTSKVVPITDVSRSGEELEYSLDWILQHKCLLNIEKDEDGKPVRYIVGNLKEQDKDLQYEVSTIPAIGEARNRFLNWDEQFDLPGAFAKAVDRIRQKNSKGVDWIDEWQVELCEKLLVLGKQFSRKRLRIIDISANSNFL